MARIGGGGLGFASLEPGFGDNRGSLGGRVLGNGDLAGEGRFGGERGKWGFGILAFWRETKQR